MKLSIRPVTADLWPALEDLFGKSGACNGCWCMYWRIGSAYHKRPREENRLALKEVIRRGPPPGLLAFDGELAVGWCQLTPRADLPWLDRTRLLQRVDDVPVWSISCFLVRRGYRKQGVTSALIAAALEAAKRARRRRLKRIRLIQTRRRAARTCLPAQLRHLPAPDSRPSRRRASTARHAVRPDLDRPMNACVNVSKSKAGRSIQVKKPPRLASRTGLVPSHRVDLRLRRC